MSGILITPPFRMSFPSLFVATGYEDGAKKFGVTAIWAQEDLKTKYRELWLAMVEALDAKAQEFFDTSLTQLPANVRRGIRNGNEKAHLGGYGDGTLFASLTSDRKPQVVDLAKILIPDGDTDRIYPGAWARASVGVYAYDNIGKGLAFGLNNLQWLGHGERLDSRTTAEQDFTTDPDREWYDRAAPDTATGSAPPADDFDVDIPF